MKRRLIVAAEIVAGALLLWFATSRLLAQWEQVRAQAADLDVRWWWILLSSVVVLATWTLLIETWRRVVEAWQNELAWMTAARIWFVSNLWRYVPGKVWQIGAMGVMAQRAGVSPVAATGSALLVNLVSLIAGFGVVVATGAGALLPRGSVVGVLVAAAGIAATPWLLPRVAHVASRITGRTISLPALPASAIWIAVLGSTLAWFTYGIAFRALAAGVLPEAAGGVAAADGHLLQWIAVYCFSYLVGYLFLPAPGGLVAREVALVAAMTQLNLATEAQATILAIVSRLWLTVLEVAPGTLILLGGALRPASSDRSR